MPEQRELKFASTNTNMENNWNDVNNTLPTLNNVGKCMVKCFVKLSTGEIREAYYSIAGWCCNQSWYSEYMLDNVTHWKYVLKQIGTVGDLIKHLQNEFHESTPIECMYYDIVGEAHVRSLMEDAIQHIAGKCRIDVSY